MHTHPQLGPQWGGGGVFNDCSSPISVVSTGNVLPPEYSCFSDTLTQLAKSSEKEVNIYSSKFAMLK